MAETMEKEAVARVDGKSSPPAPTPGEAITLSIDTGTGQPITISIRTPDQEANRKADIHLEGMADTVLGQNITESHTAGISVKLPDNERDVPTSTLMLNSLFHTSSQQREIAEKRFAIHESIDHGMREAFSEDMQSIDPEVYEKAVKVVHQLMAEMLSGNMLMSVPIDEIMQVKQAMTSKALMYVKNLDNAASFCADTLKKTIETHPKVREFKAMHKSTHGHESHMNYHPKTGVKSRTALANHIFHHGTVDEHMHGQMVNPH